MDRNEEEVVMSQTAHDAIVSKLNAEHAAALSAAIASAKSEAHADGRKAERDRVAAIIGNATVKGKELTALDLAMKSPDMKADDVVGFVAALPAAGNAPKIAERMSGQGADLALGGPLRGQQQPARQAGLDPAAIYDARRTAAQSVPA